MNVSQLEDDEGFTLT